MHAPDWKMAVLFLACAVAWPADAHTWPDGLEQFDLQSLSFTHFYRDKCGAHAIIRDPDGYSYMVGPGNKAGRDFGVLVDVSEERIVIREVIKNADESWSEREAILTRADTASPEAAIMRDPLEKFDLETLANWHTAESKCGSYARVMHYQYIYTVHVGSRVGRNFGIVTRISKNRIFLRERYQKPDGTWFEKDASIKVPNN
jgi:Tfp pilus assembly protein PilP